MNYRASLLMGVLLLVSVLLVGCSEESTDPDSVTTTASVTIQPIDESIERVSDGSVYFFRLIEVPEDERLAMAARFPSATISLPDEGCATVDGHAVVWPWETTFGPDRSSLIVDGLTVANGDVVDLGGGWPTHLSESVLNACGGEPFIAGGATPTTLSVPSTSLPASGEQISERVELMTSSDGERFFYRLVSASPPGEEPVVTVESSYEGTVVTSETGCVTFRGRTVIWPPGTEFGSDGRSLKFDGLVVSDGDPARGEGVTGPPAQYFNCVASGGVSTVQLAYLTAGPAESP